MIYNEYSIRNISKHKNMRYTMTKLYTETTELRACSCDMLSAWTPSAILSAMQETAGVHSRLLGLDRETMENPPEEA